LLACCRPGPITARHICRVCTRVSSSSRQRTACASESSSLEQRPPPAHLSTGRVHGQARVLRAGKGQARRCRLGTARGPARRPPRIKRARGVQAAVELACGRLVGPRELLSPAAQERRHLCRPEASWGRRHAKKPARRTSCSSVTTSRSPRWSTTRVKMPSRARPGHGAQLMSSRPCRELCPGAGAPLCLRVPIGDVLADSGYAHRRAESFALPMRALGARLVMDLHPNDAARRAPSPVRSCTTATCTARQHRRRSWRSARLLVTRPRLESRPTTR